MMLIPRRRAFDFFLNKVDRFVVLSDYSIQVLQAYGIDKDRISVVHIPLSEDIEFQVAEDETILYLGAFLPRKGPHIIVKAMPWILERLPDVKLYLVGDPTHSEEYMQTIRSYIEGHNLREHILILDRKPYSEVRELLQRAKVLVIPEQWEVIAPNTLTEGMVFGKAVVASRLGDMTDVIEDGENGLLADADDPSDFAAKIISVMEDDDLRLKLSRGAKKTAPHLFSEEKVYQELMNLYQSVSSK